MVPPTLFLCAGGLVGSVLTEKACNRLDRLTSGLMFVAKTRDAADFFMNQLKNRTIRKQYIARVRGEFPEYLFPPPLSSYPAD